jgi:hypothetical protein
MLRSKPKVFQVLIFAVFGAILLDVVMVIMPNLFSPVTSDLLKAGGLSIEGMITSIFWILQFRDPDSLTSGIHVVVNFVIHLVLFFVIFYTLSLFWSYVTTRTDANRHN